jgi:hypothetical protein
MKLYMHIMLLETLLYLCKYQFSTICYISVEAVVMFMNVVECQVLKFCAKLSL